MNEADTKAFGDWWVRLSAVPEDIEIWQAALEYARNNQVEPVGEEKRLEAAGKVANELGVKTTDAYRIIAAYTAPPAVAPMAKEIEFGMNGEKMFFKIGVQRFTLNYEPVEPDEFDFMSKMLTKAFSTFTHGVKTSPAVAVNEHLLEALYLAHYMISEMEQNYGNLWQINETPESLDALAMKIRAAIAAAEAAKGVCDD